MAGTNGDYAVIFPPNPWKEVVDGMQIAIGKEISRARCQQIEQMAFKKLAIALKDDVEFRSWAEAQGWNLDESETA
tara:strand:+ start:273 stop:500 length:228 start_codon:yes stop_codon:yes gene_type:complete